MGGMKMRPLLVLILAIGLTITGCSKKRVEGTEVAAAPQSNETVQEAPAPKPIVAKAEAEKYTVVQGDTLWDISGSSSIYSDHFQWPLLFKANRDQIQDPDLIFPDQELGVRRDFSADEIQRARDAASATPKYVPHTKPRETLPVDYF
jgi:hypothetical protein